MAITCSLHTSIIVPTKKPSNIIKRRITIKHTCVQYGYYCSVIDNLGKRLGWVRSCLN